MSEQAKSGGGWGRKLFACEPSEAPPPARIVEGRDPQKNVLILLEEKIGRAQNQKSGEYFSVGHASGASGGGAERQSSQSGFSSKKVRILTKKHRQFSE